ncbi:Nucleotide-binding universal stress protein, UspA family [Halopelagius inordinatus]|uniref:Nucleotide-binding universal stress protein, UspA family n=1 Tax=Halopelagius inordinatus TaxID=553467 RepID=A0A1I2NXU4_9EURY|nr:universal stress protein [Halopelagius inordinatus]SFG06407.1 Nucleotide-binding universal stress protein, UspA family [Halopelagius inordinatus]
MYDRVLVPTGVGDDAERTINCALDVAQRYDAELHVLRVSDPERASVETPETDPDGARDAREKRPEISNRVGERAVAGGVNVVSAVRCGPPVETIREYADESEDLVLLPDRGGFCDESYRVGGVVGRCLRECSISVMTVRAEH